MTQKGYILYYLEIRKWFVNRDVIFKGNTGLLCNRLFVPCDTKYDVCDIPKMIETMRLQHHIFCITWNKKEVWKGHKLSYLDEIFCLLEYEQTVPYPMSKYIAYDHLATTYQAFVTSFTASTERRSYHEVIKDPRWVEAMKL